MTSPLNMALRCQGTFASLAVKASLTEKYLVVIYYMRDVLDLPEELIWQHITGKAHVLDIVEYRKKVTANQARIMEFWTSMIKVFPGMISSDELAYLIGKGAGEIEAVWDFLDAMYDYGATPDILKHFVRVVKIK